jgi:hypothetical protein
VFSVSSVVESPPLQIHKRHSGEYPASNLFSIS